MGGTNHPSAARLHGGVRIAFGVLPILVESPEDFLLLPDREVGITRVFFSIKGLNKDDTVSGSTDLCLDHLTLLQSPTGFDRILWMRG